MRPLLIPRLALSMVAGCGFGTVIFETSWVILFATCIELFLAGFLVFHKPVTFLAAANSLVAFSSADLGTATIFDITLMCLGCF